MKLCLPEVDRDQAQKLLARRPLLQPFRRLPPDRIELLHFPYYRFALQVEDRSGRREVGAGADGILGTPVLMQNLKLRWREEDFRPEFSFALSRDQARARVEEEYRWILYRARMRRYRCRLLSIDAGQDFYYPYWIGYFRVQGKWDFDILDAVTGRLLGGPLRKAFLHALCAWAQGLEPAGGQGEGK
jgi:hypothetical protein